MPELILIILLTIMTIWAIRALVARYRRRSADTVEGDVPTGKPPRRAAPSSGQVELAGTVRQMEERLRVLERIVTDRGYDVAAQIEALRDRREVDGPVGMAPGFDSNRERV